MVQRHRRSAWRAKPFGEGFLGAITEVDGGAVEAAGGLADNDGEAATVAMAAWGAILMIKMETSTVVSRSLLCAEVVSSPLKDYHLSGPMTASAGRQLS